MSATQLFVDDEVAKAVQLYRLARVLLPFVCGVDYERKMEKQLCFLVLFAYVKAMKWKGCIPHGCLKPRQ